ncbi:MAG TPA: hypothetical protein VK774_03750 [Solirubrobacteraceae bacterium]|jgi:hypothetical protein|nr:hypothetical protein [Solirubrobacteraceae bacterium]
MDDGDDTSLPSASADYAIVNPDEVADHGDEPGFHAIERPDATKIDDFWEASADAEQ